MSTQQISLNVADGWVNIENTASPAIIQNNTSAPLKITFSSTTPDDNTPFHIVGGGEYIERFGTDPVYARTDYDGASVIVTV